VHSMHNSRIKVTRGDNVGNGDIINDSADNNDGDISELLDMT